MKHRSFLILSAMLLAAVLLPSCKKQKPRAVNPAFRQYIQAYTAGVISTRSTIKVRLTSDFVDSSLFNTAVKEDLFDFSPAIKGTAFWSDSRTIEFHPDGFLPPKTFYDAIMHLSKLIQLPDSLKDFQFQFQTIRQDLELTVTNHKAYSTTDLTREKLYGRLLTADLTDDDKVGKILKAFQDGKELPVVWTHSEPQPGYCFQVDSILRGHEKSSVRLEWSGQEIGADSKGETQVEIPPLGDFRLIGTEIIQSTENCIVVRFSDPLMADQNLDGLIRLGKRVDLRYSIEDNELKIYPAEMPSGKFALSVEPSLKNLAGKTLGQPVVEKMTFEDIRPNLKFTGTGVIMPSSNKLLLPFDAVNLKAVDVKVIRVYESNILQFLQVNDLEGQSELARVGKVVLKKTIPLTRVTDYGKWNRFSIDLTDLVRTEPGAIYSVRLGFKKEYSAYPCSGAIREQENVLTTWNELAGEDETGWSWYGNFEEDYYDYDGYYDYNWQERNNPCSGSYYNGKTISRNVLSSDLGLIAKAGNDGTVTLFVTDLLTAKPVSGVELVLYDYQQQKLAAGKSDDDGKALLKPGRQPFIAVAQKSQQTGYLKLSEGSSLSMSMFDVGGEVVQHGIKGLLYGDRGVWRPGDSLFMVFILEDKAGKLPENHPVTFTLCNPSGQVVSRITRTNSLNGFYNFSTATSIHAPTGNWLAKVKVGGNEFRKTVKIETVKPNRLKINLTFGSERLVRGKESKAVLSASWLTGAAAKSLKATVLLSLSKAGTKFSNFPGYTFDNKASGFPAEQLTIFNGNLDENGVAEFTPDIRIAGAAPGILNANFETQVFEEGGDFSVDRFTLPYYPFLSFAGIKIPEEKGVNHMLYTGKNYSFPLANVDVSGKPVPVNRLKVEVFKLEWSWWWDNSESSSSADFVSTSYNNLADSATVAVTNGRSEFPFEVGEGDWGRYYIRVTDQRSGHVAGEIVYFDWYGYYRLPGGEKQAAAMLSFSSDQSKYKVGDNVKLTIPSSEGGNILISVENSSSVLSSFWVQAGKGTTECSFEVTPQMAPNCYASVTLVQPHAQTQNDLPIRLYGVIPILVEDPASHLFPVILMNNVLVPEQKASITVKEEKGEPMTYTLAMVDEGLLDLTRFRTPDPWCAFYPKEALGVKTWDLYDLVMGAYSGELQRILSIGGDEDKIAKGNLKANRFKPMVRFMGPFELKKGKTKTHVITLPNYIGSVRVMVVAGNQGAYGMTEKTVPVRKPLMVLGTLPRVVGPGETIKLPVTVFAMEKSIREVSVSVSPDGMFMLQGPSTRHVTFSRPGDNVVMFDLKVKEMTGIGRLHIRAISGKEQATDAMEVDVRMPNPEVTDVIEKVIEPGQSWTVSYKAVGIAGTNKGNLELSSVPSLNLEKRLSYLVEYPYGCVEQTTSAVFPQLYLSGLADLSPARKDEVERNIRAGIGRIKTFQMANGGVAYWPGGSYADDWGTCYAGHFMLEAEQKGYALPPGFLSSWKNFQKQKAISWSYNASYSNDELVQAYRLYTLALARAPELGAMNRLVERKNLPVAARWRLAAAYQIAGKPEEARKLIATATMMVAPYRELGWSYGSGTRDEAMIVEALCLMNLKARAANLVTKISEALSREEWMSTQTTAYSLIAISRFIGTGTGKGIDASYSIDGGSTSIVKTEKAVSGAAMNLKKSFTGGTLRLKNNGKNLLYAKIILQGIPAAGEVTPAQNDLKMSVVYLSTGGKPIDPGSLSQGTNFIAEVTVTNPGMRGLYKQMVLTQMFPSGWEILNARMSEMAQTATQASYFTYQNVRDDRIYTYFDLDPNRSKSFRVMLNSSYPGRFYLPALHCSAMYDNTINARIPGRWIEIAPSGK